MKKIISFIIAITLLCSFMTCTFAEEPAESETPEGDLQEIDFSQNTKDFDIYDDIYSTIIFADEDQEETVTSNYPLDIYTFVHLSDTQYYTALAPSVYIEQCRYIATWRNEYNIRFLAQSGDIIDCAPLKNQWDNAVAGMRIIENAEIPRMITAGNHDQGFNYDYSLFCEYFGTDTYRNNYTEMYSYNNGEAQVQLVPSGNGHTWMFVGIGYGPTTEALLWASSIMSMYPNYPAVIVTHDYLETTGELSETGRKIAYYLVEPFPNTRLVLCGHNHAVATNISSYDDDRDGVADRYVYALLSDYQADGTKLSGKLRLLTVSEPENLIYVRTYSTEIANFVEDDEFIIRMDGNWFSNQ